MLNMIFISFFSGTMVIIQVLPSREYRCESFATSFAQNESSSISIREVRAEWRILFLFVQDFEGMINFISFRESHLGKVIFTSIANSNELHSHREELMIQINL